MVIMAAIAYVWFFVEESERIISLLMLATLFAILSLEYIREGVSTRKSQP